MATLAIDTGGPHDVGCICPICHGSAGGSESTETPSLPQFDAIAAAPGSIDPLLNQTPSYYWNGGQFGTGVTITYSFMNAPPAYYSGVGMDYINSTFTPFTASEMSAARAALASWSEVANVNFVEVPYARGSYAQIQFGNCNPGAGIGGFAFYPYSWAGGGDIFLSNTSATNLNPTPGSWGYLSLLHEIGHALGLKHPGNYNAGGGGTGGPYLPAGQDNHEYTVMAYSGHPLIGGISPITPMLDDIAALQFIYGARVNTRAGNDTYTFSTSTEIRALWDAGGTDTFSAANQTAACEIDLEPGHYSSIGTGGRFLDNIAIAQGCWIENAVGGAGNDVIHGNALNNTLSGGSGADTLSGGLGNDVLIVDNVNDIVSENAGEGVDTVVASVSYSVPTNVENLILNGAAAIAGTGSALADIITAYGGSKTLLGLGGNDNLTAFGNNNVLLGGDGNDGIGINGTGNTLDGGAGDDFGGITGDGNVLVTGAGDDGLVEFGNNNTLDGGEGNDNFAAFGTRNTFLGGAGNDGLGINGSGGIMSGGDGDDFLGVTGSNNQINGDGGNDGLVVVGNNNALNGGAGDDVLLAQGASTGNVLTGGTGADRFVLAGTGTNTVADFAIAEGDVLDLTGSGVANLSGLTITQAGADTQIAFGGSPHIVLSNVLATDLTVAQFIFS